MIGDSQVFHAAGPRSLGHLGERGAAVAPIGVAMKRTGQVSKLDKVRKPAGLGRVDLAGILAQLGRDIRQPERLEDVGLVLAGDWTVGA